MLAAYGPLQAGAAAVDVTPPPGAWLAGFEHQRAATGCHDRLWARALAVAVGPARLVLVTVDCLGLLAADCRRIAAATGLNPDHVLVCATHTHSGPDTVGLWGADARTSGLNPAVLASLCDGAAAAARAALAALQPADLRLTETAAPVRCAVNVREPNSLEGGLAVMHFEREGRAIATLVNWACHPETLRGDNRLYSADFAGPLRQRVEDSLGGVCLFVNGALGAMVTVDAAEDTFAEAARIGQAVADEAVAAVFRADDGVDTLPLRLVTDTLALPVANPGLRALTEAGLVPRELTGNGELTTRLSALRLGEAELISCPGELQPRLGRRWKRMMQRPHRFLAGLCHDELGYILDRDDYGPGHYAYESSLSLGPETGLRLTARVQKLLLAIQTSGLE